MIGSLDDIARACVKGQHGPLYSVEVARNGTIPWSECLVVWYSFCDPPRRGRFYIDTTPAEWREALHRASAPEEEP